MKICFIGKYPPIQGGVSQNTFWTSYALATKKIEVHVVTNAYEVEHEFRIFEETSFPDILSTQDRANIQLHSSSEGRPKSYIPWANPLVTKLASIATDVIEKHKCDLIFSYYLEPYGLAAYLASCWTGVPYGIRHAGSDVGHLFQIPIQQTAYKKVMLCADYVFATPGTFRRFLNLGVAWEKLYANPKYSLPTKYFCPEAPIMDIHQYLLSIRKNFPQTLYQGVFQRLANKAFDPSLPTIGIYGKVGYKKGSFDLIHALGKLRAAGVKFNFLALTQGHEAFIVDFAKAIQEHALQESAWLLPFLPHWKVPQFIRTCTAVCFLERDFPISLHTPLVPREILACGSCLILSQEIAEKQPYRDSFSHGSNIYLVDPTNIDELASTLQSVISDPAQSREIGMKGYKEISSQLEDFSAYTERVESSFQKIYNDIQERKAIMSLSEMQACLARLYVNKHFRMLFHLNEDIALQDYRLSEEEQKAIKSVDKKMLDYFARTLVNKRMKHFQLNYPLLNQVLDKEFDRYFGRFYELYLAKPHEDIQLQIIRFGEFMEQSLAPDEDVIPYGSDLARYEKLCFIVKYHPSVEDTFATINKKESLEPIQLFQDTSPLLKHGVHVAKFTYNIDKIANDLQHQKAPGEIQAGTHWMLFQQAATTTKPLIYSISPATGQLILLCDGQHNLAEIIQEMETITGRSNLEEIIRQILNDMYKKHIIGI